ncbi:MAG: hypothetical protein QOE77_610 [Blastocatellia bacterium]|nr:hypothetical protein [Blastocatellia bacterium]
MPKTYKTHLLILASLVAFLIFPTEAKADVVQLTLTNSSYDMSTGSFTLIGFFTNSGSATFTANRWDMSFTPDIGPLSISANTAAPNCCPYTLPVPGMSDSAVLPLLNVSLLGPPASGAGTYFGTLTFSGFDSNGVAITTAPVRFSVNVPVPEPATILLLGSGLIAVGSSLRKRLNRSRLST